MSNRQSQPIRARGIEGVDLKVMIRATDAACELIEQADVASMRLQVFDRNGQETYDESATVANVIIDSPADGYNFEFTVPGSALPTAGDGYSVYLWCRPVGGGSDFPIWFLVDLTPVKKVAF